MNYPGIRPIIILCALIAGINLAAQDRIILRGSVTDSQTGEAVIGANVIEYDENKRIITGTITDVNGNYTLNVTDPDAIIMFSFIGYKAVELPLNGRNSLNVEMEPESFGIDEITITAESTADPLTGVAQRNLTSSRVKIDIDRKSTRLNSSHYS